MHGKSPGEEQGGPQAASSDGERDDGAHGAGPRPIRRDRSAAVGGGGR
jgi:hypothetical protein